MLRILTLILFLRLLFSTILIEVMSHAKVSKNEQLARSSHDLFSSITRSVINDTNVLNEKKNRNIHDFITVSPVYIPPRIPKLKKGEVIDHPVASRYSTLDHEITAKLDATAVKKQIQQRFHPPAIFETSATQKKARPEINTSNMENTPGVNVSAFPGPIFSGMYEYNPPEFLDDESLMPEPIINKYPSASTTDKIPDSYKPSPNKYHEYEMDYSNFGTHMTSLYENNAPSPRPKPVKFVNHHNHQFSTAEDPYEHDHHNFHHDVIYDYIPEYHEHHHKTTTEEPEMNDQRLDKRPYSYYFIGKKLWYIPLYFSIYFIIYIGALVLKSIARHKINFPAQLTDVANRQKRSRSDEEWWNSADKILEGVERFPEISGKNFEFRTDYR